MVVLEAAVRIRLLVQVLFLGRQEAEILHQLAHRKGITEEQEAVHYPER
jgi:hypothetical protein